MATLTHPAFRTLVSEYGGCDLYVSEMISAEALLGGTPFEHTYRDARPEPGALVYQLVGRSADTIVEAARRLADEPVHGIDVNMGCSAPQIAKRGAGVTWMQYPAEAARLIARLRGVAPGLKISAKFRLGAGTDATALSPFARALEEAGADALTLHPRYRRQSYSRPSHWRYLTELRQTVGLPVYGSGDVTDRATFEAMLERTGVDGVMIGRAAAQKPWLFAELAAASAGGTPRRDGLSAGPGATLQAGPGVQTGSIDLAAVAARFHELLEAMQPAEFLLSRARRFHAYFLKNLAFGHRLSAQVQQIESYEGVREHVRAYFEKHPEYREVPLATGRERVHA